MKNIAYTWKIHSEECSDRYEYWISDDQRIIVDHIPTRKMAREILKEIRATIDKLTIKANKKYAARRKA